MFDKKLAGRPGGVGGWEKIKMSNCSLLTGYESSDGRARVFDASFILVMAKED